MKHNNKKLPRGVFYYVQLGPQFYAGEEPIFVHSNSSHFSFAKHSYFNSRINNGDENSILRSLVKRKPIRNLVGHYPKMVYNFNETKKFRRLNQAQRVYELLRKQYHGIAIPKIGIHKDE